MQREIEAKFLHVNHDDIRQRLKKIGAVCEQPMRLMRRVLFDHDDNRYQKGFHHQRLRVRDEGDKVTVTFKSKNDTNYVHEVEIIVNSYDETVKLFESLGMNPYSYQESKRETWHYKDVEVVLDEWPWLRPYIEIEGKSESAIKQAARDLGFDWTQACFGSVDRAYRNDYPGMKPKESIGNLADVRFDDPLPTFLKERMQK